MIDFLILIFTYLPSLLIYLFVFFSLVSYLVSYFIPFGYKHIIKNVSMVCFVLGVYLLGGLAVTREFQDRQKEWNSKIEMAEQKSLETNTKIKYVFKERTQRINNAQTTIQERIKNTSENIDAKCVVTKDTIEILNEAAKNDGKGVE